MGKLALCTGSGWSKNRVLGNRPISSKKDGESLNDTSLTMLQGYKAPLMYQFRFVCVCVSLCAFVSKNV